MQWIISNAVTSKKWAKQQTRITLTKKASAASQIKSSKEEVNLASAEYAMHNLSDCWSTFTDCWKRHFSRNSTAALKDEAQMSGLFQQESFRKNVTVASQDYLH